MRTRLLFAILTLMLPACGPLMLPMIPRLDEEQQKQVDTAWHNMLTPSDRLSRETLLDTLSSSYFYAAGIDRADYRAEKQVDNLQVVMEIHFNRTHPAADAFYVNIYEPDGKLLRSERYSRGDVEKMQQDLMLAESAKSATRAFVSASGTCRRSADSSSTSITSTCPPKCAHCWVRSE